MGFSDPDKVDERHDWACQYIADPKERIGWIIVDKVLPRATAWRDTSNVHRQYRDVRRSFRYYRPLTEQIVTASERSAKPIAFIDVVIGFEAEWQIEYELADAFQGDESKLGRASKEEGKVIVEVKIRPVPLGQAIRQIKTYLSLLGAYWYLEKWSGGSGGRLVPVLVTAYDLSAEDVGALEQEGIRHLILGESFTQYAERRHSSLPAQSESI